MTEPRRQVPSCPDFGDPDFGEATCPSWHADVTSPPVGAVGPSGPVGRPVGEIRADLAHCDRDGVPWPEAARRLLADVPGLLAEVEAADRFELAAGVEREALLAELAGMTRYADAQVRASMRAADELRSLRGVVQAVREPAAIEAATTQVRMILMGTGSVTLAQVDEHAEPLARSVVGAAVRAALAAAADAPQPEPERCSATHQRYGRCDLRAGHDGRHTSDIGADGPDDPGYTWTVHGSVAFRNGPRIPS